jgi:tRNA dimethylallyltransferase
MREKLLVIVGPTAVGKTALSIDMARHMNGEIISGDSMQVYRGMDIGTAKISLEEMRGIPHYLIDTHSPAEPFSVSDFQSEAKKLITDIHTRGKLPMIVGGTGLYIQSVIYNYQFSEASQNESFRTEMERLARDEGNHMLHQRLHEIDPISASRLHPNDLKRVIRALEIYHITGKTMAEFQNRSEQSPYQLCMLGLTMDRDLLYERINHRIDLMIHQGLVDEVRGLLDKGYLSDFPSMQGIGYKEMISYLEGDKSFEEAVEWLKKNSRNFAKRQLTWFRAMKDIHWIDVTDRPHWSEFVENIEQYAEGMFK